jgi:hypothetical protein
MPCFIKSNVVIHVSYKFTHEEIKQWSALMPLICETLVQFPALGYVGNFTALSVATLWNIES